MSGPLISGPYRLVDQSGSNNYSHHLNLKYQPCSADYDYVVVIQYPFLFRHFESKLGYWQAGTSGTTAPYKRWLFSHLYFPPRFQVSWLAKIFPPICQAISSPHSTEPSPNNGWSVKNDQLIYLLRLALEPSILHSEQWIATTIDDFENVVAIIGLKKP